MYRSILIIKPGAIGDLLHLTPVIRSLKQHYPEARIVLLVGAAISASLFENNPLVSETIIFDRKGEHRSLRNLWKLWQRLRTYRFDLVLNFQRSNLRAWFLTLAALPCRLLVYHKARGRQVHAVVNHLETLTPLRIDPAQESPRLDFVPSRTDVEFADEFWAEHGLAELPVIAFNPGTAQPVKNWPPEKYSALGRRIYSELGARVLLLGSNAERELTAQVAAGMGAPALDLTGCTIGHLGAVLTKVRLLVVGDTGPMHLACAVGTPVVVLYGPIGPLRSGPIGVTHRNVIHGELPCVPCSSFSCKNKVFRECMEVISVDEVFTHVSELLSLTGEFQE